MTKVIGIVAKTHASDNDRIGSILGVSKEYYQFAQQFGKVVMICPDEFRKVDLLILQGGADIYEERQAFSILRGNHNSSAAYFEGHTLQRYIDYQIPILGICAGFQALGAFFGGKLLPNIDGHSLVGTHKAYVNDKTVMDVDYDGKVPFHQFIDVTSRHHQGFIAGSINETDVLEETAWSLHVSDDVINKDEIHKVVKMKLGKDERISSLTYCSEEKYYGVFGDLREGVEAFRHKTLPIIGLQWHPESISQGYVGWGDAYAESCVHWLLNFHNDRKDHKEIENTTPVGGADAQENEVEVVGDAPENYSDIFNAINA